MKHLLLGLTVLFIGSISAQTIQAENVTVQMPEAEPAFNGINDLTKSQNCGPDTIQYSLAKASGLAPLNINNSTSASAVAQYFDAPQELSVSGVTFYAYKIDATGGITMNCNVEIYAVDADSLPSGAPLATTTVAVDTSFGGGALDTLRKHATFSSPITINNPYVVVVSNPSAISMGMIFNDYEAVPADGAQEWLASALIGANWLRSYDINIGGATFDADGLFEPHVSYELTTSFLHDNPCLDPGLAVNFTNQSSPINYNRMYNQAEYLSLTELSFNWNYGDGSPAENAIDATHTYASAASYAVTLTDTIYGWTTNCIADTIVTIGPGTAPTVAFTSVESGLTSDFTNNSTAGPDATYTWDFGDGNTSTTTNPSHTYAADGTYTVCLEITDSCLTETSCQSVTVASCTNPVAAFTFTGTSPTFDFTNTSTTTGTVTYAWDFGDGNTATTENTSHTYSANGTYTVTLTITDDCGTNTVTNSVTVNTVGLETLSLTDLVVYPNPSKGIFSVKASTEMKNSFITDLTGKIVLSKILSGNEAIINTDDLANGAYFLSIQFIDGSSQKVRLEIVK